MQRTLVMARAALRLQPQCFGIVFQLSYIIVCQLQFFAMDFKFIYLRQHITLLCHPLTIRS